MSKRGSGRDEEDKLLRWAVAVAAEVVVAACFAAFGIEEIERRLTSG